jgi:acetyl esterase/lipase
MFHSNTTIRELSRMPVFRKVEDLFFTHPDQKKLESSLKEYGVEKCGLLDALQDLALQCRRDDFLIPLYPEEWNRTHAWAKEAAQKPKSLHQYPVEYLAGPVKEKDEKRGEVCLLNYAVHPGKPYVLILPGGGYNREWMLVEGYPLATEINRLGYNAFLLVYRCGYYGCLSDAVEDTVEAVRYIEKHKEQLRVSTENYAVSGASAGGHLAAGFALEALRNEQIPAPHTLWLCYPGIGTMDFYFAVEKLRKEGKKEEADTAAQYLYRMCGEHYTRQNLEKWDLLHEMTETFPDTYLIHMEDDPTVPVTSSHTLDRRMTELGIRHITRFGERGGHSFGLGKGTDAEDWLNEACAFWQMPEPAQK